MSEDKELPVLVENKNAVQLHDSGLRTGSLIAQSMSRLNEQQAKNLMAKAAEEGLRLEIKQHDLNMEYVHVKKKAEDHVDLINAADKTGITMRHHLITEEKTSTGTMRYESKSGGICFVATVAYGVPNHPDVIFLRGFRDEVLSQSKLGRGFIAWYWRTGPKLARIVGTSVVLKKIARFALEKFVLIIKICIK